MPTGTTANTIYIPVGKNQTSKSMKALKLFLAVIAIVACIAVVSILMLTILYSIEKPRQKLNQTKQANSSNSNDLCLTRYCIRAAHHLQENMDESVDPCENFYEFSCGSWMKNTKISSDSFHESSTRKIRTEVNNIIADLLSSMPPRGTVEPRAITNARRLYQSCIDEDAIGLEYISVIHRVMEEVFGRWPLNFNLTSNQSTFDLYSTLLKTNQYNDFPLYHVTTTIDYGQVDKMKHRIQISPARPNNNQDSYFIDKNEFTISHQRFKRDNSSLKTVNHELTMNDQDIAVAEFEENISKYLLTSISSYSSLDIVTTVKDLTETIGGDFDFSNYIRRVYLLGNVTLADDDIVVVNNINSIRTISLFVATQSSKTLQAYIALRFLKFLASHLPKRYRTNFEDEGNSIPGILDTEPRTIECAKYVNENMEFAVSKLYIDQYYDQHARRESIKIVDNIRNTFINMVNQSMWMDNISKKNTIEKAQAILAKVGYPDYLKDNRMTKLESLYVKHNFDSSYMENVLLLLQLNLKRNLRQHREPTNRQEWIQHGPTVANAFYRPFFNDIIIPAGFLRPPLFHKDAPKYLNYGAIGSIVGHEITHGFDELRRHLDKDGNPYTFWSQSADDTYEQRSKCIIEQYNNYTVSQINHQVDGDRTREENIADNDGLKKSFYAYQKWVQTHNNVEKKLPGFSNYSAEQMFFISFGQLWCSKMTNVYAQARYTIDPHSPSQFRTIGSTSNFAEFDRAFGCKPGQGNSRVDKCSVW